MYPAIEQLLPQRHEALLLDAVLEHSAEQTVCTAHIGPDHPYLEQGRVNLVLALELLAQATAAHGGLAASNGGAPRRGYVAAVPVLELSGEAFAVGDQLEVRVRPSHAAGPLARYTGEVWTRGERRAHGEISVYLTEAAGDS